VNIRFLPYLSSTNITKKVKAKNLHLVSKDALGDKVLLPDFRLFFRPIENLEIKQKVFFLNRVLKISVSLVVN
jgi:hypothetical protein